MGVASRIADNDNMYMFTENALQNVTIFSRISASDSEIDGVSHAWVDGELLRGETDGSDLELFVEGDSKVTTTDTNITGNLNAGIYSQGTNGSFRWDNWEAGDLGAPPAVVVPSTARRRIFMRSSR